MKVWGAFFFFVGDFFLGDDYCFDTIRAEVIALRVFGSELKKGDDVRLLSFVAIELLFYSVFLALLLSCGDPINGDPFLTNFLDEISYLSIFFLGDCTSVSSTR